MKHLLFIISLFISFSVSAQEKSRDLIKSWPLSITPLSLWNADISASGGAEYRFHPSFSVRTAADYIYGSYKSDSYNTNGVRLRQEFRYYIAGNRLINSRSRVWPYIAIAGGGKHVVTAVSRWRRQNIQGNSFSIWQTHRTLNREWFIMGKTGMQTAFGKNKRLLFDFSLALGTSNNNVSYRIPGNDQNIGVIVDDMDFWSSRGNLFSGKLTAVNAEACLGYRLLK